MKLHGKNSCLNKWPINLYPFLLLIRILLPSFQENNDPYVYLFTINKISLFPLFNEKEKLTDLARSF